MSATILNIFIAPVSGSPMMAVDTAELVAEKGVVGDRYFLGVGKFSDKLEAAGKNDWHITLIESEEIDKFVSAEGLDLGHGDFRRNVVTSGIRLNPLVGKRFKLDGIELEGIRFCEPCAYLAGLLSERLLPGMVGKTGLRARIISSGSISKGGSIDVWA